MDGDDALKNASEEVFIVVPTMLCTWHVNKCVLANCKNILGDDWPAFNSMWCSVIQAQTIDQFEERWLKLCSEYSNEKTRRLKGVLITSAKNGLRAAKKNG